MFTHQAFDSVAFNRRSDFFGNRYADAGSSVLIGRKNGDEMLVLYPAAGFAQGDELTPL